MILLYGIIYWLYDMIIIWLYYMKIIWKYQIISGYIRHITPETARFRPFAKSLAPNLPQIFGSASFPWGRDCCVRDGILFAAFKREQRWVKRQNSKCTARATAASKSSNTSELYWLPSIKHVLIAKELTENWRKCTCWIVPGGIVRTQRCIKLSNCWG